VVYGKPAMGTDDGPVCMGHTAEIRMSLRTLHSDQLAPDQVLGAYECPECGAERRLPIQTDAKSAPPR
jgi:hypothetical protein